MLQRRKVQLFSLLCPQRAKSASIEPRKTLSIQTSLQERSETIKTITTVLMVKTQGTSLLIGHPQKCTQLLEEGLLLAIFSEEMAIDGSGAMFWFVYRQNVTDAALCIPVDLLGDKKPKCKFND